MGCGGFEGEGKLFSLIKSPISKTTSESLSSSVLHRIQAYLARRSAIVTCTVTCVLIKKRVYALVDGYLCGGDSMSSGCLPIRASSLLVPGAAARRVLILLICM